MIGMPQATKLSLSLFIENDDILSIASAWNGLCHLCSRCLFVSKKSATLIFFFLGLLVLLVVLCFRAVLCAASGRACVYFSAHLDPPLPRGFPDPPDKKRTHLLLILRLHVSSPSRHSWHLELNTQYILIECLPFLLDVSFSMGLRLCVSCL